VDMCRPEDVQANREYFARRLKATKQENDIIHKVKDGLGDSLLLTARPRASLCKAHIAGAWCVPYEELAALAPQLPSERPRPRPRLSATGSALSRAASCS